MKQQRQRAHKDAKLSDAAELLVLAKVAFKEKDYLSSEKYCDEILAADSKNYEAWKLKGEAINYQITAKNQRLPECYSCIMSAYGVLTPEEKVRKKYDLLISLTDCMEGEVDFWLKQFENRPYKESLERVKKSYIDAYYKMESAFQELGLQFAKDNYLTEFDNLFIELCYSTCYSAWKSTVAHSYYREYRGNGKDPFSRDDERWVIKDTDIYRPTEYIWDKFIEETDSLVELLQFAERQFNDMTNPKIIKAVYESIAYYEECVIFSGCWEITSGYSDKFAVNQSLGWREKAHLSYHAKNIRRKVIEEYIEKGKNILKTAEEKKKINEEKEEAAKKERYLKKHKTKRNNPEFEQAREKEEVNILPSGTDALSKLQLLELTRIKEQKAANEIEYEKQLSLMRELGLQEKKIGIRHREVTAK